MHTPHLRRRHGAPLALLALGGLAACGGDEAEPTCLEKNTCALEVVSGDEQAGQVGEPLRAPIVIRVVDELGAVAPGIPVVWSALEGGATLSASRTPTSEAGEASVTVVLGTEAGPQRLEVQVEGAPGRGTSLSAIARPAAAESIARVSGDGQTAAAGGLLLEPLRVRVTDRFGNGVPDVQVVWRAVAGMGSIDPAPTDRSVTDRLGVSTATATLGPRAGADLNIFSADPMGFEADAITFTASARAGPPSALSKVGADRLLGGQPGETLSTPLAVRVTDRFDNPVRGATVTFSILEGMGASLSEANPLTGAGGEAAVRATLGPQPGRYAFTAEVGQITGSPQTFRATAFPPICSADNWCWENPLPQGNDLRGAYAASPSAAWVVGELGTILRWNGAAWLSEQSNVQGTLLDVHGTSENQAVAVGAGGLVAAFDGARWSSVSSGTNLDLEAVWLASPTEGWAVGDGGTILRFDGSTWAPVTSPTQQNLLDVEGLSPTEVWAVGERGTFLRYDGTSWSVLQTSFDTDLAGVLPVRATEVWMAGDQESKYLWDGSTFTAYEEDTGSNLTGMWQASDGTLFAFGLGNVLERWDGRRWFPERTVGSTPATGIWDMLEVGGSPLAIGDDGRFLRRSPNGTWEGEATLGDDNLQAIWGASANQAWAVGDGGTVVTWDGQAWTETEFPVLVGLRAVTGTSATDVWAVGQGGAAFQFDGVAWTERRTPIGDAELLSVWPLSASEVFAVGRDSLGGVALRWDGSRWTQLMLPAGTPPLRGVYGARSDEIWAVGGTDAILRYDGAAWTTVESPSTQSALQGVRGTGPRDIWAWGSRGTILHYDGSAWRLVQDGSNQRINDIWPLGQGRAIAVGTGGLVLERAGSGGFLVRATGANTELFGVWGASPDDVWAVGAGGTLLHREAP